MIQRYISDLVKQGLQRKIVLISGPRQVGKTTLSRSVYDAYDYINYDDSDDRAIVATKSWDRDKPLIIFDELHKMPEWKRFIKAVYDKEGVSPQLLVTGSARLDTFRKVGDSLAGRFLRYRLHPFDVKELVMRDPSVNPADVLERLMQVGGFPEPYVMGDVDAYNVWRKSHLDIILRQDLVDLENVSSITAIETLIQLLRDRVGTPVSYSSLARDLQVSHNTVKRWLTILENLFVIFKVTPFHRNIARSILKEPKYYFYDTGLVKGGDGARFENIVAGALLKELEFMEDTKGVDIGLHYLKNTSGVEVDFLVTRNDKPTHMIEVKLSDTTLSKQFKVFRQYMDNVSVVQVVKTACRNYSYPDGCKAVRAAEWLAAMALE